MTRRQVAGALLVLSVGLLYGVWRMFASAKLAEVGPKEDWLVYEDAILRLKHPKGGKVWPPKHPLKGERTWSVDPPGYKLLKSKEVLEILRREERSIGEIKAGYSAPFIGVILVSEDVAGRDKRPLDEILAEYTNSDKVVGQIDRSKRLEPNGGSCVTFTTEGVPPMFRRCGEHDLELAPGEIARIFKQHDMTAKGEPITVAGTFKKSACIGATAHALCHRRNGHLVRIWSDLSRYYDRGQPDQRMHENAENFRRFLESLEFK